MNDDDESYRGIEISGWPVNIPTGISPKVPRLDTSGEGALRIGVSWAKREDDSERRKVAIGNIGCFIENYCY